MSFLHCFGPITIILLSYFLTVTQGQCPNRAGRNVCEDCLPQCPIYAASCNIIFIANSCKKTCNICSSKCKALNCSQKCVVTKHTTTEHCACRDGYRLNNDGRTCNDIDECSENPSACSRNKPICVNTPGTYQCKTCEALHYGRMLSYYSDKSKCCKINKNSGCGKSTSNMRNRLVIGKNALMAQWPWSVYVHTGRKSCSGSLITNKFVVTSASCIFNHPAKSMTIYAGIYNIPDNDISSPRYIPRKIYFHPNYFLRNNDIALIELSRSITPTSYTSSVCLPGKEQPLVGQKCYTTSYGSATKSAVLQESNNRIVNNSLCEGVYQSSFNPRSQICVSESTSSDRGTSGGSLVCQRCDSCDWYIAGILSNRSQASQSNPYVVYTKIVTFEKWIVKITKQRITNNTCSMPPSSK